MHKPVAWPLRKPAGDPAPPADATPDTRPPLGARSSPRTAEPLLRRPAVAAAEPVLSPPSLELIIAAVSDDQPANHRGPAWWRKPQFLVGGLAVLAVVAPISVGIAVVVLAPELPTIAAPPLRRTDQTAFLQAPLAAPAIPPPGASRVYPGAPRAPVQIGEPAAPTRSQSNEDRSAPPPAASRNLEAAADPSGHIAAVEPEKDTSAPETRQLEPHHEATSPERAMASASPPPAGRAYSAPPAPAPLALPGSKALAEANSRIAAVVSERDALAAEVARLERQEKFSSPPQANPSPPPAAAASLTALPAAPPIAESGLDLSAASAALPQGMPARVLIRYARNSTEARQQAENLATALARQGVEVADFRESASAIRTELSFSYAPDEAVAQQVGRLVGVAPVRRLQPKDALMARPGTVELNLSGESHLAAIKTTSSRESSHE